MKKIISIAVLIGASHFAVAAESTPGLQATAADLKNLNYSQQRIKQAWYRSTHNLPRFTHVNRTVESKTKQQTKSKIQRDSNTLIDGVVGDNTIRVGNQYSRDSTTDASTLISSAVAHKTNHSRKSKHRGFSISKHGKRSYFKYGGYGYPKYNRYGQSRHKQYGHSKRKRYGHTKRKLFGSSKHRNFGYRSKHRSYGHSHRGRSGFSGHRRY